MLNIFNHWRWTVCVAILCSFLAELMNPTSSFVRAEPTPVKKVVKVEIIGKTLAFQVDRRTDEAPLSDVDPSDGDEDEETVLIHSHAWVDLGGVPTPRPVPIFKKIVFSVRDLMAEGVNFPEIDPPSFV